MLWWVRGSQGHCLLRGCCEEASTCSGSPGEQPSPARRIYKESASFWKCLRALDGGISCLKEKNSPNAAEARPQPHLKVAATTSILSTKRKCASAKATPIAREPPTGVSGACPLACTGEEGGPWVIALFDWLAVTIGRCPPAGRAGWRDMAEARKEQAGHGLPGGDAAQWPLQRYGRFMPSGTGEPLGPGLEAGTASSPTWKVRPEGRKDLEALNPAGRENCGCRQLVPECQADRRRGHRGTGRNG